MEPRKPPSELGLEEFAAAYQRRLEKYWSETQAAWNDVIEVRRLVEEGLEEEHKLELTGTLGELHQRVSAVAERLLFTPLRDLGRRRPMRRVLDALEELHNGAAETARGLVEDSPMGKGGKVVPLRANIIAYLAKSDLERAGLDGAYLLVQAQTGQAFLDLWQSSRYVAVSRGQKATQEQHPAARADFVARTSKLWAEAEGCAGRLRQWLNQEPERLRAAAAWSSAPRGTAVAANLADYRKVLAFWRRQQRAVGASIEFECQTQQLNLDILQMAVEMLDSIREGRRSIRQHMEELRQALERWEPDGAGPDLPAEAAPPMTLDERLESWALRVRRKVAEEIPEQVEVAEPRSALPRWRTPWRVLHPRQAYGDALGTLRSDTLRAALGNATTANTTFFREAVRAREVVEYWRANSGSEPAGSAAILAEAKRNALALLAEQQTAAQDPGVELDREVYRALVTGMQEVAVRLEIGRVGVLALLTRRRRQQLRGALRMAATTVRTEFVPRLTDQADRLADRFLESIGWKLPTKPPLAPVVRRATFWEAGSKQEGDAGTMALYGRLFRLAPVTDPRFLVGRAEEMAGLERALGLWQQGRFAAVLVVGERGSGKTSVLNCAEARLPHGLPVLRANFERRLTTAEEMDRFLAQHLGLPVPDRVAEVLRSGRRILILEELERTFMRRRGGFGALQRLRELVEGSGAATFWILSLNDRAFRYLSSGLGLGSMFSYRINAMNVSREDLQQAIRQRHNLSGLNLVFHPPSMAVNRVGRLRRGLGLEGPAAKEYFDRLHELSGGAFRSAFEIWLRSIERIEGNTVEVRPPESLNFRSLVGELVQMDHLTLVAIQQHGSLTCEELSEIVLEPVERSRMRLERLQLLGLLEKDPEHGGIRVRPEAQRFTEEALMSVNLV